MSLSTLPAAAVAASMRPVPYIRIIHQPSQVYRMRYKAEKRTTFLYAENFQATEKSGGNGGAAASSGASAQAGGAAKKSSMPRKKAVMGPGASEHPDGMFPKIEIVNGEGPATLIVSCVSYTEPHHVHPHRLIGECCKSGVAVLNIDHGEKTFELVGVSIEFTKRHDIDQSINELRLKNVDPFNSGFEFPRDKIDLTRVRLCFQVYLRDSLNSNNIIRDQYHILKPVLSNVIYNSSRKTTLQILRTANLSSPAPGGRILTIFLKKLEKDQKRLSAKFFDQTGWSRTVEIHDFHYQCAVMLEAPPYKQPDITAPVKVNLKLFVPFKDDKEKAEFISKQLNEDNEDEFDENEDTAMSVATPATTSLSSSSSGFTASASAAIDTPTTSASAHLVPGASAAAAAANQTDMFREVPDGKYESRVLEFTYFAPDAPIKRKLDTLGFYDFSETAERDLTSEIGEESRTKLAKRQCDIIEEEYKSKIPHVFQDKSMNNTVSFNFAMRHNAVANSMQLDQYASPIPPPPAATAAPQYSNNMNTGINTDPAELREAIDLESELAMSLDAASSMGSDETYDLDAIITFLGTFDEPSLL